MNNSFFEIYKGTIVAFLIKSFSILFGYLFVYLITYYTGSEGMGVYSICNAFLLVFTVISVLGLDSASIRFISENDNINRSKLIYLKILSIVVPFSLLISFLFYCLSPFFTIFLNDRTILYSLKYMSFGILPLSIIYINSECFRGFKNISLYTIFKFTLIPFLSSIILFLLNYFGNNNIEILIIAYLISICIVCIISTSILFNKMKISSFPKSFKTISSKYLLNISFPMLLTTSMFYIIQWTDTLVLGYYESTVNIGIYNVAIKMSMASSIILFSINSISAPKYSKLFFSNKIDEFISTVKFSSKLIFWLSCPIIAVIFFNSEIFLGFFGVEFINAKFSLWILLLGQFFNILCGSVGYILMMTGNEKILRNIIILSALINIILNIILIPQFGILGAAIASTSSMILWNMTALLYIYNKYNFITINIFK